MVIWITGMSGAGKTTLCEAIRVLLKPRIPELILLDGDVIRTAFGSGLGFAEDDRKIQIQRIQSIAKVLSDQDTVVLIGALYAHPELLDWNRKNFPSYFEVYVKASMALLKERDSKGLYYSNTPNVVGVDIPWREPASPDMVIVAEESLAPDILARQVARAIPRLAAALPKVDA
jgi:adenylylsulfate kinase-like enzyme